MAAQLLVEWTRANQLALMDEVAAVRARLERLTGQEALQARSVAQRDVGSALDVLCRTFGLSSFEREIVVMCAAIELDGTFAELCARAHGDALRPFPSFGLALAAFENAHWSALTSQSPLRRWSLVRVDSGPPLTSAALRIDEYVLHDLAGVPEPDARLRPYLAVATQTAQPVDSQREAVDRIVRLLRAAQSSAALIQLVGPDADATRAVAHAAFAGLQTPYVAIDARALPRDAGDLEPLVQAWMREVRLRGTALYVDAHALDDAPDAASALPLVENVMGTTLIGTNHALPLIRREAYVLDVAKPTRAEQRALWQQALHHDADMPAETGGELAAHFDLSARRIAAVSAAARAESGLSSERVWSAARAGARTALGRLSQRLDSRAAAAALVLPAQQRALLDDIVAHARHRIRVYEEWQMGRAGERGLGLSALFYGPSGTGKTLAAEAIGAELQLDVHRVDLSRVVNKYVGETEKNLRRVFDAAEEGGAILLFDECDAIFGKRGEIQSGHDRYANVEVSYLLQRMEAYRGIAILTTNLRSAIDSAFLRRIRFVVSFPFPDYDQRMAIWQRAFPPAVPTEGLDFTKVARLNVTGANIRNIALHAAFLAVDRNAPVRMEHLLRAAQSECLKIERSPSAVEMGGWV